MGSLFRSRHFAARGQSVVEFGLVVPFMLFLIVIPIADFGRFYASAVAVEASAREAADYGAFGASHWSPANVSLTTAEMERRACVAAAGSHLGGYQSSDPQNATCTNPSFTCTLENGVDAPVDCATSGGMVGSTDCSQGTTEPPCTVHVRLDYDFTTMLQLPPMPAAIHITRDSRFRVSNLSP